MSCGQAHGNLLVVADTAPSGVHCVHSALFVVTCDNEHGHRIKPRFCTEIFSHIYLRNSYGLRRFVFPYIYKSVHAICQYSKARRSVFCNEFRICAKVGKRRKIRVEFERVDQKQIRKHRVAFRQIVEVRAVIEDALLQFVFI